MKWKFNEFCLEYTAVTGDYYNDNIEINKDENSDDGDKMRTMIMTMAIMIK